MTKHRVLFLSNCYGEDRSAALIADELRKLRPDIEVFGASLISDGGDYRKRQIPVLIEGRVPPSGGFPRSVVGLARDVSALHIPVRYFALLRRVSGTAKLAVVVGDVFLLVLGSLALRKRCVFLAPAKSNYQNPHSRLEECLMSRFASQVFTHDELTAGRLREAGVPATFVGNPMVDGLRRTRDSILTTQDSRYLVGILPGSREEAYENFLKILTVVMRLSELQDDIGFAAAIPSTLDQKRLIRLSESKGWRHGEAGSTLCIRNGKAEVLLLVDAFVDVIKNSDVVIGLAGTANEQAAFLGKPTVSFVGSGPQTTRKRMTDQERLLGGNLKFVDNYPEGVVDEVVKLLGNNELRLRRGEIGTRRMGPKGGAAKIARFLAKELKR
jgi:uncharacterized protein (TIGR03492 family)